MEEDQIEMTQEEIDAIEAEIPEWKRGALVVTNEQALEDKDGLLKRFRKKVKSRIMETEAAKTFKETEQYE
jgi:hypothetical protein